MLQSWTPILPEHIWSSITPKEANNTFPNSPPCIGSGPFQVVEWKKGEYVRMEANEEYWGGAPKIDELIFRFYTNQDSMVSDLKLGSIQYCTVPQAQEKDLSSTEGITVNESVDDTFENMGINCYDGPSKGHPALKDPAFRHALNWAVDRARIAEIAYAGGAVPATGFLPSDYWQEPLDYHWEPSADVKYTYDLEKAKQELDAAGYTDSDGDGVRDYKGEPIELRLWAVDDKPEATRVGKLIATSLGEIGLKIDLRTVDDGTASAGMYNYEGDVFTPDYDLFIWYWTGDFDPGFLLSIFTTDQIESWSDCNWSNAEYDALFKQQDTELDDAKRKDLIWQMQEIVYDQTPYVVYAYARPLEAYDTGDWDGWVHQPAGSGSVQNPWTYLNIAPKTAETTDDGGSNTTTWIIVVVVAAVVIIIAIVLLSRRSKAVEED
jgi:peptide/nickel transport system substrate-binding protein